MSAPRQAYPDRYEVSRRGTPDPDSSRYFVLDLVHDKDAREVLRTLVNKYRYFGPSSKADELERVLDETEPLYVNLVLTRNQVRQAAGKRKGAKTPTKTTGQDRSVMA